MLSGINEEGGEGGDHPLVKEGVFATVSECAGGGGVFAAEGFECTRGVALLCWHPSLLCVACK